MKSYIDWADLSIPEQNTYIERALFLIDSNYVPSDNEHALAKRIYESKFRRNNEGKNN